MKKIVLVNLSPLPEALKEKIHTAAAGKYEVIDILDKPTDEQLAACEIIFGNAKPDLIAKMPALKWVHAQTAGVDIYLNSAPRLSDDILLTNSTGAYGVPIAEHMLTYTLMLLRHAYEYITRQQEKTWGFIGKIGHTLYGRRVTVVGMGDIGGRYAMLCHAMGAKVCGVVRTPRAQMPPYIDRLYTTEQLDEALQDADIVALALPGTSETAGILSRERLRGMKKGALIVNVGRGTAIDQDALVQLLKNGHLGGAALDVTTPEPLPQDNPLWELPNVLITPHVGHGGRANTDEIIVSKFLRYLDDYIAGRKLERLVDRDAGY